MKPKHLLSACLSFATLCAANVMAPEAFAQAGPPAILGVSETVALPNQTLTITGENFDWTISAPDVNDSVTLNGLPCPVLNWSIGQITVSVPKDAVSGSLVIQADNGQSNAYPVTVGPRGVDILSASGSVRTLLGASRYAGPAPTAGSVAIAATPDGMGYWTLLSNGTLQAYGDAKKLEPSATPSSPAVGLAMDPPADGGWILSQNGAVTPFGNAPSLGSAPGPAVGIASAGQGNGYWVLEKDGTIKGFGSVNGSWQGPASPVAIAAMPGGGAVALSANGGVNAVDGAQAFGDIASNVSLAQVTPTAIAATPDGNGYYVLTKEGLLYGFGDAVVPNPMPPLAAGDANAASLAVIGPYQPYGVNNFVYWYPTGDLSQYIQYQNTMGNAANIISPHWFWINADGTVGGPAQDITQMVAQMQSHGIKVVPMFGRDFGGSMGPLSSPQSQQTIVQGIVEQVKRWHLNGVNIDFEGLPNQSAGYLSTFIQKLREALGAKAMIAVDVYPNWAPYTGSDGKQNPGYADTIYDYKALAQNAYVVIMAYPMSYAPGPLSSLIKDSAIIQYVLHNIDGSGPVANPHNVYLGIPGYGESWLENTAYGLSGDLTVPQIDQILAQTHANAQYHPDVGESSAVTRTPLTPPPATLSPNDTGGGVVSLQYALNTVLANPAQFKANDTLGKLPTQFPLQATGFYGDNTTQAVYAFQQDWGVTGDTGGVYGANTASKMNWVATNTTAFNNVSIPTYLWWETAQGNVAHAQLAANAGLAGVAMWSMGEADPNYFTAMAQNVNLAANGLLKVSLSNPTLYQGVRQTEIITVTQGSGFPLANVTVQFMGQAVSTDANGQAAFTVTPNTTGTLPVGVNDPTGNSVASDQVTVSKAEVVRQAGADRFGTAIDLGNALYGQTDTVILTTAGNYPDALAGAPLATKLNAPILITMPDSLTPSTLSQIERYGAKQVILLGGTAAISAGVEQTLNQDGFSVTRYAGQTRYGTAEQIAQALGAPTQTAVIASGASYPDALSIAPIAAQNQWPLLLSGNGPDAGTLSPDTVQALQTLNIRQVYLIGSAQSVPQSVFNQLQQMGISVNAVGGADSYATNLAVIQKFDTQLNPNRVLVATGQNFPDALAAGPVAAAEKAPLLLVPGNGPLTAEEAQWLTGLRGQIGQVTIAGGPAAVSDGVQSAIAATLP